MNFACKVGRVFPMVIAIEPMTIGEPHPPLYLGRFQVSFGHLESVHVEYSEVRYPDDQLANLVRKKMTIGMRHPSLYIWN